MDRTLLRIDSGMAWMRFLRRRGEVSWARMARAIYWSALYKLAILDMESLADRLVLDLAGRSEVEMLEKCRAFYRAEVATAVAPAALRAIRRHRAQGHVVAILTGSTQFVADAVAQALGIDHAISSRVEIDRGQFTGRMAHYGFGTHKVALAESFARDREIDLGASWFYSDSYNDLPMLDRVGRAVVVNPDGRLRRHARRAGWPIEIWR
jgi:HAD superfamily hydrolase (TIGR01490 family)